MLLERITIIMGTIAVLSGMLSPLIIMRKEGYLVHNLSHIDIFSYVISNRYDLNSFVTRLLVNIGFVTVCNTIKDSNRFTIISFCSYLLLVLGLYISESGALNFYPKVILYDTYDVIFMLVITAIVTCIFYLKYRSLFISSLDRSIVEIDAFDTVIYYVLLCLITTFASEAIGSILSFVLLFGPGSIAMNLSGKFDDIVILSICISLISVLLSIYIAWENTNFSNIIIMIIACFYFLSLPYKKYVLS